MTPPAEKQHVLVQWNDAAKVGLEEIDTQHHRLFDLTNSLWHGIITRASREEIMALFDALGEYTQTHFADEESLMELCGYPELEKHRKEHRAFIGFVAAEKAKLEDGEGNPMEQVRFLADWLQKHIMQRDKAFAFYFSDKGKRASLWDKIRRIFG